MSQRKSVYKFNLSHLFKYILLPGMTHHEKDNKGNKEKNKKAFQHKHVSIRSSQTSSILPGSDGIVAIRIPVSLLVGEFLGNVFVIHHFL